jgi:protein-tyrosine phosphatase
MVETVNQHCLMTQVLDWQGAADPGAVVHQAAAALREGRLVAFPTETVYGLAASALAPAGVARLRQSKGRPEAKPLTLAIAGPAEALDWVPHMSLLGRRLARRCWPGPVTLVFNDGVANGLASRLPGPVQQWVAPGGALGLRVPDHDAILQVLHQVPGPLVLSSANPSGMPPATTAQQVIEAMGQDVDLIIDDGPSHYGQASTVVKVNGNRFEVLREGVVSASALERLTPCMIVFVCTGNTCRSPLAEGLCKQLLAQRLGCTVEDLPERGFIVLSAGLAAMMGGGAAPEASLVAQELGADLSRHASRPLTADLVGQADHVITMTRSHLLAVVNHFPRIGPPVRLLGRDGQDIADPIGCDQAIYRECAQQILQDLERLVPEFLES